jgi:hypothetical protein
MRKKLAVAIITGLVIAIALTIPAISQPYKPLRSQIDFELVWDPVPHWEGTLTGDIEGEIIVALQGATFPGTTEHFYETWVITTSDGTIEGYDNGVWSFVTFKFRANGKITDATGSLEHLEGCNVHFMGTTTEFPVAPGEEVTATATMTIIQNEK